MADKRFGDDFQEFTSPPQWDDMLLMQSSADRKTYKTKRAELLRNVEIEYTVFQFAKNASKTVAPTIGWTDAPPTTADNEWLWIRQGKIRPLTSVATTWSAPVRIKGEQGGVGDRGKQGIQGFSSYDIAVKAGYTGTEAQFGADQSAIAANSARLTAVETTKADLGTDGYVYPAQISPLQGKQTGYIHIGSSGTYGSPDIDIPTTSITYEILCDVKMQAPQKMIILHSSSPIGSAGRYVYLRGNTLTVYYITGEKDAVSFTVPPMQGVTHLVVSYCLENNSVSIMLNGQFYSKSVPTLSATPYKGFWIARNGYNTEAPYHQGRIFNKALSQEEMIALWNGGHPEEYRMIDKSSLFAEYIPEYLSLSGWRDTSGNGNDLTATGSVALSYGKKYSGSALTPLFVARGAVYNDKTGYYELNGLTDITEEQMIRIYEQQDRMSHVDCSFVFSGTRGCRTHFTKNPFAEGYSLSKTSFYAAFAKNRDIEIINMANNPGIKDLNWFAEGCVKLKRIIGLTPSPSNGSLTVYNNTLVRCSSLEYLEFKYVKFSLNIVDSPLLTRESILYMITNSANTQPIILTLHQTASARLTPEDIALASSKNITIAVA